MKINKDLLENITILYVEDENDIREIYVELFQLWLKKIYTAPNGKEGLELYKEHQNEIDLIVSDIKMPKLDGIDMIKEIKKINPNVSVIFTTAFSDSSYLLEALKLKADDYILKPIDSRSLLESINKIILPKIQQQKIEEQEKLLFSQNRLASMGEMLGNIAHQWKQPLSTVSMQIDNIKFKLYSANVQIDDNIESSFKDISEQIQYMSQTVRDFIDFLQPNKLKRDFSTSEMIKKSIQLLQSSIERNFIKIDIDIKDELNANGKKNEFLQVLVNLIKNSKDILVEKNIQNPMILIYQQKNGNNIEIFIKDNAGGIDEDMIEKVFEKNISSRKDKDGSGLGLFMSKQIIDMMGGEMSLKNINEFGKGVEFKITLPISDEL